MRTYSRILCGKTALVADVSIKKQQPNDVYNRIHVCVISTYTYIIQVSGNRPALNADFDYTVYPKKYAHGFCFAVLCCGYTLTDFPISIRLTSLALWQSNDCPSASKATLMNMDKYFMWIHYERLHNHNKAKHNKTVCIFLGIYCSVRTVSKSSDKDYFYKLLPKCVWSGYYSTKYSLLVNFHYGNNISIFQQNADSRSFDSQKNNWNAVCLSEQSVCFRR